MKTKKYVSPEMNVVKLEVAPLLSDSGVKATATAEDAEWG